VAERVVAAFVWTTRGLRSRQDSGAARASSALEILDRRLASGEIKTDQYVELRRTLVARPEADPSRDSPRSLRRPLWAYLHTA
jgi:hypothetical protein